MRFAARGRGDVARYCGRDYEMAAWIIASTDKCAQTAMADVATGEGQGGRVWQLVLAVARPVKVRVEYRVRCCLGCD